MDLGWRPADTHATPRPAPDLRGRPLGLSRAAAIDLLEKLVAIPSTSGHEQTAAVYLVNWFQQHNFDAQLDEVGNAVGSRGDGPREVVLLGHIDTFPGDIPIRREGDWLYGRGTVDAKGPLCAFSAALASLDVPDGWRVTVVGAVEEEAPSSKGARHRASLPVRPDYCIIGEPSRWDRITRGYKGFLLASIHLRVPYSHSAGQDRLPAEVAVDCWNIIVNHCDGVNVGRKRVYDQLLPSLRAIATRDEGSYGIAELQVGFRLPLDIKPELLHEDLLQLLPPVEHRLTVSGMEPAFLGEKNSPLVRAFLAAIREQQGRPRFVVKTGTCDMNVVGPVWQCPILAYGPGDSTLDHTPGERIDLEEYGRSIAVLSSMLNHLMAP